ncbi:MAG: FAD-dependent pyridine nucleotide-disulfide oxidoreductase, partial [Deltaproteobacteria bacterium]|nr:FAD-dependent pyridine nucleotide-disulfide oxidoreductase [Deltaproteobacteria bacterium]
DELGVVCIMDMGNTAAFMKASPVLPPRQKSVTQKGIWAKWMKVGFEKYFLWKMKNGMSNLP